MATPLTREDLLEVLEVMADGQARALRRLRRAAATGPRRGPRRQKKSNIALVEDILRTAATPLHINEVIARAAREHGRTLPRESIVSALTKKVADHRTFARVGRNVFALLPPPPEARRHA